MCVSIIVIRLKGFEFVGVKQVMTSRKGSASKKLIVRLWRRGKLKRYGPCRRPKSAKEIRDTSPSEADDAHEQNRCVIMTQ